MQMLTTGNQLKAARALIGMDQATLAKNAKLAVNTIRNMEAAGGGPIAGRAANVHAVQAALEAAGVTFTNGTEPGVKVRRRAPG
jgi:transcriptional regulator with XRE-family HTH domain